MIVHTNNPGHVASQESVDKWDEIEKFVSQFVLWAYRRARKPMNTDALTDVLEIFLEDELGLSRTARRRVVDMTHEYVGPAIAEFVHHNMLWEEPSYSYKMTAAMKKRVGRAVKPVPPAHLLKRAKS